MLLALLALLLASIAATFIAEDLAWRERALQTESAREHLRAMLDGALAEALAQLNNRETPDGDPEQWPSPARAVTRVNVDASGNPTVLHIGATYNGRRSAVDAVVQTLPVVSLKQWGPSPVRPDDP